jgi:hypothetical protein
MGYDRVGGEWEKRVSSPPMLPCPPLSNRILEVHDGLQVEAVDAGVFVLSDEIISVRELY